MDSQPSKYGAQMYDGRGGVVSSCGDGDGVACENFVEKKHICVVEGRLRVSFPRISLNMPLGSISIELLVRSYRNGEEAVDESHMAKMRELIGGKGIEQCHECSSVHCTGYFRTGIWAYGSNSLGRVPR